MECKELLPQLSVAYHRPPVLNSDTRLIKALFFLTIQSHIDGDYSYYQPQLETLMEWKLLQHRSDLMRKRIFKCPISSQEIDC